MLSISHYLYKSVFFEIGCHNIIVISAIRLLPDTASNTAQYFTRIKTQHTFSFQFMTPNGYMKGKAPVRDVCASPSTIIVARSYRVAFTPKSSPSAKSEQKVVQCVWALTVILGADFYIKSALPLLYL